MDLIVKLNLLVLKKIFPMKRIYLILILFFCGCNPTKENNLQYQLSKCETPNVPYGAPAVSARFRVDSTGSIKQIELTHPSGIIEIDRAVIKAIENCRVEVYDKKGDFWIDKNFTWSKNIGRN